MPFQSHALCFVFVLVQCRSLLRTLHYGGVKSADYGEALSMAGSDSCLLRDVVVAILFDFLILCTLLPLCMVFAGWSVPFISCVSVELALLFACND